MQTFFVNTKLFDEKVIDSSMSSFFVRLDDDLTEVREAQLLVSMVINCSQVCVPTRRSERSPLGDARSDGITGGTIIFPA